MVESRDADKPAMQSHQGTRCEHCRRADGWAMLIRIIGILSILRCLILNIIEYGFIMDLPLASITPSEIKQFTIVLVLNAVRSFPLYYINKCAPFGCVPYIVATEALLSLRIFASIKYTYLSAWAYIIAIVTDMKLVSYYMESGKATLRGFGTFMLLPTLIFSEQYPKKDSVSYRILLKKSVYFACCFLLFILAMDQCAIPAIYRIQAAASIFSLIESSINLSISVIVLFNLLFQMIFNSALVIVGELTGFQASTFSEWWNSETAGEFWARWNVPVHLFIFKYIYTPLLKCGLPKWMAKALCFVVSGALHEYVTAMSIRKTSWWIFVAFIVQIPLISVSMAFKRRFPAHGNAFFWLSFCVIGQPMFALLFYRSAYIEEIQRLSI